MTDLFFTDDGYHGGTFQVGANFGFYTSFRPRDPVPCSMPPCKGTGGEPFVPPRTPTPPFDYGDDRRVRVLPEERGAALEARDAVQAAELALPRPGASLDLRRLLAGARPLAAHARREVRRADGRRVVRRRGPERAVQDLPRDRAAEPGDLQRDRRRAMGARRMGAVAGREPRPRAVRIGHRRVLARADHLPVLRAVPEGQRRREAAGSLHVRDGHQRVAPVHRMAAEGRGERRQLYFHANGKLSFEPPARSPAVVRRVRERPGAPGAVHPVHRRGPHRAGVHGCRPALLHAAARRARVPDRSARGGRDDRGADLGRSCASRRRAPTRISS